MEAFISGRLKCHTQLLCKSKTLSYGNKSKSYFKSWFKSYFKTKSPVKLLLCIKSCLQLNFCLQFLPVMATCSVWVIKCQKSVSNLINTRSTPYMYLAITKPNQVTRQLILSLASQVIVQVDFMQTKVDNKSKNVVAFSTNLKLLVCDRHRL